MMGDELTAAEIEQLDRIEDKLEALVILVESALEKHLDG